jgi:O-antigen ligase
MVLTKENLTALSVGSLLFLSILISPFEFTEDPYSKNLPIIIAMVFLTTNFLRRRKDINLSGRNIRLAEISMGLGMLLVIASVVARNSSISNLILGSSNRGDGLFFYLLLPGLILGVMALSGREELILFRFIFVSYMVAVVVGLVQILFPKFLNPIDYDGVVSVFVNTNTSGAFLSLVGLALLFAAKRERNKSRRNVLKVVALTGIVLSLLSNTLQAPLLIVIVALIWGILKLWSQYRQLLTLRKAKKYLLPTKFLVSISMVMFIVLVLVPQLNKVDTFRFRLLYWDAAIETIKNNLVFGIGPGNFSSYVSEFRSYAYVQELGVNLRVDDPHNVFLSIFLAIGLVPVLLIAFSLLQYLRNLVNTKLISELRNPLQISLLIAFIAYLNISYVSVSVIFFSILAIKLIGDEREEPKKVRGRFQRSLNLINPFLSIVIVTLSIFGISQSSIPKSLSYNQALELIKNRHIRCDIRTDVLSQLVASNYTPSTIELDEIYSADPRCASISNSIFRFKTLQDVIQDEIAIKRFYDLDPKNPDVILLAALASLINDNQGEVGYYKRALNDVPLSVLNKASEEVKSEFIEKLGQLPN